MLHLRRFCGGGGGPLLKAGGVVVAWSIGSGALWFLLPQIAQDMAGDVALVGLLMSLPALVAALVDAPVGVLAEKIGFRRVLLLGLTALTLLGLSMLAVDSLLKLILFLALLGLLYPMIYVPIFAYVMEISPKESSSQYFGVEMSFIHSGFAIGPVLAGYFIQWGHTQEATSSLFYTVGSLGALILALMWFRDGKGYKGLFEGIRDVLYRDGLFVKGLRDYKKLKAGGLSIIAMTFLFTFYDGAVWLAEPLYYRNFTSNPVWGGIILSAFVLPLILFEYPAGLIADRFGRRLSLAVGVAVAGVFTLGFTLSTSVLGLTLNGFLATCGLALAWPSMEGMLAEKTREDRGAVVGVWSSGRDLGYVLGPALAGAAGGTLGLRSVFAALGAMLVASVLLVIFMREE